MTRKPKQQKNTHTHTHTHLTALFRGLPGWASTRKVKLIWISLKRKTVSGSGISWAICKSAPCSRHITTPAPHNSVFTSRMPFLPPNQQCQSTEGKGTEKRRHISTKQPQRLRKYSTEFDDWNVSLRTPSNPRTTTMWVVLLHTEIWWVVVSVVVVINHASFVERLLDVVVCAFRIKVSRPREVDQRQMCVAKLLMHLHHHTTTSCCSNDSERPHLPDGSGPRPNIWFLGPTRVTHPKWHLECKMPF